MKWNEKETYKFVKIYFAHEHLWNTRHVAYKSNERRLKAYKEVIAEFNESTGMLLTLNEVRIKIKNLKSTYSQELNKIKIRSGANYTYKPAMKWFSVWHKYIQNARKRAPDCELEESNITDEDSQQKHWLPDRGTSSETDVDPFATQQNNDYVLIVKPEPIDPQFNSDEANSYDINRQQKLQHTLSIDTSDGTIRGSMDSNFDLLKDDEFDIYGKYIASQLRSMDIQRALNLQLEIQSLVSEARLADLSKHCPNFRQ